MSDNDQQQDDQQGEQQPEGVVFAEPGTPEYEEAWRAYGWRDKS